METMCSVPMIRFFGETTLDDGDLSYFDDLRSQANFLRCGFWLPCPANEPLACGNHGTGNSPVDCYEIFHRFRGRTSNRTFSASQVKKASFVSCACRKLNPGILVMQSAQGWATKNVPGAIDGARDRGIFLQG
jgi:hypothetical protein